MHKRKRPQINFEYAIGHFEVFPVRKAGSVWEFELNKMILDLLVWDNHFNTSKYLTSGRILGGLMFRRLILAAVFSCSLISIQKLYAGAAASAPDNYGGGPTPSPTPDRTPGDGGGDGGGGNWNPSPTPDRTPGDGGGDGGDGNWNPSPTPDRTPGDGGGDGGGGNWNPSPTPTPDPTPGGGGGHWDSLIKDPRGDNFAGPGVNALNTPMPRGTIPQYQMDAMRAGLEEVRLARTFDPYLPITPGTNTFSQVYNYGYFNSLARFRLANPNYPGVSELAVGPVSAALGQNITSAGADAGTLRNWNMTMFNLDRMFLENINVMVNVPGVSSYTPPPGTVPPGQEEMMRLGLTTGAVVMSFRSVLDRYTPMAATSSGEAWYNALPLLGGLAIVSTDKPSRVNSILNHEVAGHIALNAIAKGLDPRRNIDFSSVPEDVMERAREVVNNLYNRPPASLPYNNLAPGINMINNFNTRVQIQEGLIHVYSNWGETISYGGDAANISGHLQGFGRVPKAEADRVANEIVNAVGPYIAALNQVAGVLNQNIDSSGNFIQRGEP